VEETQLELTGTIGHGTQQRAPPAKTDRAIDDLGAAVNGIARLYIANLTKLSSVLVSNRQAMQQIGNRFNSQCSQAPCDLWPDTLQARDLASAEISA